MNLRSFIALIMFAAALMVSAADADEPRRSISQFKHTAWKAESGAPAGIQALAQTPDGFLWTGGETGLFRFDGLRFERMSTRPLGLPEDEPVSALMAARNGDLWIGFLSGRFAILRGDKLIDRSTPASNQFVQSFLEDRSGAVWALTANREHPVMRYAGGRWTMMDRRGGVDAGAADFLAEGGDGSLWLANKYGIQRLAKGDTSFRFVYRIAADVGLLEYTGFATGSKGDVWNSGPSAGTRRIFDPAHGQGMISAAPAIAARSGPHSRRVIVFARDGAIWGATIGAGVFRIENPEELYTGGTPAEEIFTAKQGLSSDFANALLSDREGNIWVGSTGGLDRFRPANIAVEAGVPPLSRFSYAMLGASDGSVYIADSDRLFQIPPGGQPRALLTGLDNPQGLCEARDGAVWLIAYNGFFRTVAGRFQSAPRPAGNRAYFSCVASSDGRLWLNPVTGGLVRFDRGGWSDIAFARGETPLITQMSAAPEGGILAYVRSGPLIHMGAAGTRVIWQAKDMPDAGVVALYADGDRVLIATGSSLAIYRGGRVAKIERDYPWLHGISGMIDSRDGHIWISSRAGILRLAWADIERSLATPAYSLQPLLFGFADGLPTMVRSGLSTGAARGGDGRLWFITSDEVVRIDPAHLYRNTLPPPVKITALSFGRSLLRDPRTATLPAGTGRIAIDYTALSLSLAEGVRFRYRLDGVDEDWVDPGAQREAIYTNLAPGRYRFTVIAANSDGVWNRKGATLAFTLPPTFVQSIWFKLLAALLIAALVWGAYLLRVRHITSQLRTRLEGRISERERIARELHDTLLQGVQGLALRFQAVQRRLSTGQSADALIEETLIRTDEVLAESRERVHELRRPTTHEDLANAWIAAASGLDETSDAKFEIVIEGAPLRLHQMVFEELQRIGEEALRNAFRHADAKHIKLTLSYRDRNLLLVVRDDGAGLPTDVLSSGEREGHFGLLGMRERAGRIGGTLSVASRPGFGTELSLLVPARTAYAEPRAPWWKRAAGAVDGER